VLGKRAEEQFLAPQARRAAQRSDHKEAAAQRVSYGFGPHRGAMGLLRRVASEARTSETYQSLTKGAVPYEEINGMIGK
jgi:hypothetical protein